MANRLHIVIRPLRTDDLELFFEPVERAVGEEWLARQERGELYVAVAELEGTPAGRRCLDFTYYAAERSGFCFAAAILPEWQSRGIGSKLDDHFGEVARTRGFQALRCVVAKTNPRARSWHERLGYRRVGEGLAKWVGVDGREVEVDCWEFKRSLRRFSRWKRSIRRVLKA